MHWDREWWFCPLNPCRFICIFLPPPFAWSMVMVWWSKSHKEGASWSDKVSRYDQHPILSWSYMACSGVISGACNWPITLDKQWPTLVHLTLCCYLRRITIGSVQKNIHPKSKYVCGFCFSDQKNLRKKCVNSRDKILRQQCVNKRNSIIFYN